MTQEKDYPFIRIAIDVARKARDNGNHPFGAILVDQNGQVIAKAENTVVTTQDCTAHAELNLVRIASKQYSSDFLSRCTLYTSTEPCPMCSGAIFWANIRRVVFGLSEQGLYDLVPNDSEDILLLSCRDVYQHGKKSIEVIGPLLEDEAREVHTGFWS